MKRMSETPRKWVISFGEHVTSTAGEPLADKERSPLKPKARFAHRLEAQLHTFLQPSLPQQEYSSRTGLILGLGFLGRQVGTNKI